MYDFLKRNKEWLFSGIGVVVVVGVISLFKSVLFDSGGRDHNTPSVVSKTGKEARESLSPVTLQEFHEVLINKTLTELQRMTFLKIIRLDSLK